MQEDPVFQGIIFDTRSTCLQNQVFGIFSFLSHKSGKAPGIYLSEISWIHKTQYRLHYFLHFQSLPIAPEENLLPGIFRSVPSPFVLIFPLKVDFFLLRTEYYSDPIYTPISKFRKKCHEMFQM